MIGLCKDCGTRLKFDDIPEGFASGAIMMFVSTPIFFISIFNWMFLVSSVFVMGFAILGVWLLTRKIGGYIVAESVSEYKKSNIGLAFMAGLAGFMFSLLWCFLALEVLV